MTLAAIMTIISIYAQQSRAMIVKLPLGGTYVGRSAADIDSYVSATEEPYLSLNYHSFSFKEPRGGPVSDSKFLKLTNAGPGRFRWEITYDCPWLELSRLSGDVGSELQFVAISVNPSGMEVGVYTCALTISGEGAVNSPQTVTVSLTIVGPRIALSRRTIGFDVLEGRAGPDDQTLTVSNGGGGTLRWEMTYDCGWLTAGPASGERTTGHDTLTLHANTSSLQPGDYACQLTFTAADADNSPQMANVNLTVHRPEVELSQRTFNFQALEDRVNPEPQVLTVSNVGGSTLHWEMTYDCDWLTAGPTSGELTTGNDIITLHADTSGLQPGDYACQLTFTAEDADNSPQTVNVNLTVHGPEIGLSQRTFNFQALEDRIAPEPQVLTVSNVGGSTLHWEMNYDCGWLTAGPASGELTTGNDQLMLYADTSGLQAGEYACQLTFTAAESDNNPQTVDVSLTVVGPEIVLSKGTIGFDALEGRAGPDDQTLTVSNGGGGTLRWEMTYDCGWLTAGPTSGELTTGNDTLTLHADTSSLQPGDYACQLTFTAADADNSPQMANVNLTVHRPEVELSQRTFNFQALEDRVNPEPQVLTVSNVGGSTLHWEMTYDCDWLTAGPASGAITSGTSEIILQPHTSGLAGGVYDCQLAIWNEQAPDSPEMVDVEFVVRGPVLDVSANEVLFVVSDSRLEPEEHTLSITNSGGAGFDWTAVYNCSWLEIDPPSGSLTDEVDTITLRANPEGLAWGRYSCQLTVIGDNASNSPQTITVSLHAVANVPEDFDTIQAAIDAAFEGDVIVVSPGTYYENITFGEKAVVLTSTDPDDPAVVSDTVIDGMGAGPVVTFPRSPIHNIGLVLRGFTITGGGGVRGGAGIKGGNSLGVISRCVITGNIAKQVGGGIQGFYGTIERCRIEGNFTYGADGAVSGCRATIINCVIRNNHGGGLFNCDGSIVNCTITGNSGDAFGGVRRCDGEIVNTIISGNSFPDMHDENQAQISFSCFPGASGEGNLDVDPEFAFSSGYRIIAGSACIDAGTNDVEYGLRSNKGYGPGLFDIDGSLRITDGDGDGTVTVDIGAFEGTSLKPIIACSAQRIDFYMELSGPEPQDQVVSIRNAGGGILNWQATADCGWLEVAAAGEQTGEITLSADVAGLGVGNYSCMVTVAGEGAINSPRTIEVNLHIHIEGQVHVPAQYGRIQAAIYAAQPGERVIVAPGIYYENIDMAGRNIILQSTDPGNRAVVDSTIIDGSGSGRVATFSGSEDESCVLSGLTITGGRLLGLGNHGAGINGNGTTATISDCAIVGNRTDASGGGLMQCDGMITRCLVAGNRSRVGGGLSNCNGTISNCVVAENTAIIVSGGINNSDGTITNCTIADNIVNSGSGKGAAGAIGGCDGSITNCIFYGNTGSHVSYCSKPSYSCFNGGSTGTGNIRAEPLFALDGDYHLLSDSPCIDAGTNEPDGGLDATDHDGLVRISDGDGDGDGLVDMGAHEFIPGPFIVVSPRSFEFVVMQDRPGPEGQALRLCNSGTGTFDWSIAFDSDWLRVSDDSGSSSGDIDQLTLTVDGTGLDCGFYSCTMTISAPGAANSEMQLAVNVLVKAPLLVPGEYATIQNAINAARAGDIVLVADGVYTGDGNRDIEFGGKAITVTSVSGAQNCIIDCQGSEAERHRGFYFHNNEDADSVLDGFTITNGDVVKDKNIWSYGGAIYCYGSSPTIKNCVFRDNAAYLGGGVFVRAKDWPSATGHLSPVLINCDFITNRASYGGGMYSSESNSTIDGGVFVGNHADIGGGGANTGDEDAVFVNCIFTANTANYGAGVYTGQGRSTLTNCVVAFNSTYEGKYDARGAGVFVRQTGHWCTNYWSPCYYYSEAVLTNCILWGNSDPDVVDEASQIFIDGYRAEAALNYSCIQGWTGALGGVGNIGDDPLFVRASDDGGDGWGDYPGTPGVDEGANDDYGDFDLRAGSPCIDAGTDGGIYDDIEGSLRPFDWFGVDNNGDEPEFDMGAYEAVREVEAEAMLVPKAIHATGGKGTILAILYVPRTVESGDIETDSFALYVGEADQPAAEATWSRVIDLPHRSQVFVVFDRDEVLKAAGNIEDLAVRIVGELRSGGYIYAEAGVRILHPPVGASRRPVRRLR